MLILTCQQSGHEIIINVNSGLKDFGMTVPISEITLLGFCRLPRLAKYKALSEFFASMERLDRQDNFYLQIFVLYLHNMSIQPKDSF